MPNLDLNKLSDHPDGAVDFFKFMMRFEYALKATGYLASSEMGSAATPGWNRFADSLGADFFSDIANQGIARTILTQPPSRQVVTGAAELGFRQSAAPRNTQMLFEAVRLVRNNLFHGGKAGDVDHNRNEALISEAISVLSEAVERGGLRHEFEGLY